MAQVIGAPNCAFTMSHKLCGLCDMVNAQLGANVLQNIKETATWNQMVVWPSRAERQTYRQTETDRQSERVRQRQTERDKERQRETERHRRLRTDRSRTETENRLRQRQNERMWHRETEKETQTHTEIIRKRHRQTERLTFSVNGISVLSPSV